MINFKKLDALDQRISERLVLKPPANSRQKTGIEALRRFSEAGSYGIGWILLFAVVGVYLEGVIVGAVAGACVVGMLLLNTLIKSRTRRERPKIRAIAHAPKSSSMPSAHTSMAMVGASVMSVIAPDYAPLWWIVAIGLGVSRVLLGMHWLGDVLAGAALGLLVGLLVAAPLVSSL